MNPTDILEATLAPAVESARPRVGFVSLGCPKNLVDSEVMMGLLDRAGAELTADPEAAEILVVNTCSFIDSAKQESVNTILEMVQHKKAHGGKAQRLIVAGCLVERYRDEIQKNIPEVDAVVGTGELESILAAAGLSPTGHPDNSPFHILTQAQIDRIPSAVSQHSRPESDSAQLRIEHSEPIASRPEGDAATGAPDGERRLARGNPVRAGAAGRRPRDPLHVCGRQAGARAGAVSEHAEPRYHVRT